MNERNTRYPLSLALAATCCVTLLALPAWASQRVDERMDAASDGRVSISNTSGDIEVEGWSRNEVEITGTMGDEVEELIFDRSGDTIRIKVKIPEKNRGWKDVSADLSIRVPEGSSIDVATISADIEVSGVMGEQDLQAISGDIDSEVFGGDLDAETVSGDIEIQGDGKSTEMGLTSVSGDISAQKIGGDVDAETVSGDLGVVDSSVRRAKFETVNGDTTCRAALEKGGRLDIETVNGSVDVEFIGDVSARFEIETFNGRIRNCFGPKAERTSKYAPGWEVSFSEGSGDGRVSIATLNGSVDVCKQ